jgi:transposase
VPERVVLAGIHYRLRTACQWKALPPQFSSGSTCHLRFQQWGQAAVFQRLFTELARFYDQTRTIQWRWAALDTTSVRPQQGGPRRARIPRTAPRAA